MKLKLGFLTARITRVEGIVVQNGKEKYKSTIDSLQNGSRMSVNCLQGKRGMSKTILCTEKWILLKNRIIGKNLRLLKFPSGVQDRNHK